MRSSFLSLLNKPQMEDLTKHQLILLVLLITFVTSIGTGIITFTLLQEAPVEVTQNINRVVEKTIERVVPMEGQPEKVVTTVVVNEEDRVLDAIAKNEKSIVRLKTIGADGTTEVFAGMGLVIGSNGNIVTDLRNYNKALSYSILFYDDKTISAGRAYVDSAHGLVFIQAPLQKNDTSKYTFYPATFGNSDLLKIGQTLVAISGKESNAASIGRIRQLDMSEDKKTIQSIISDIPITRSSPGSPAINLSGEIVGMEAPFLDGDTRYSYIPSNIIKSAIPKALEELAK